MNKEKPYTVSIFCGSKIGNSKSFERLAKNLAKECVKNHYTVIYGGGKFGLMGIIANTIIENKGKLISIIPKYFKNKNVLYKDSSKKIFTDDFFSRKKIMIKLADIFIVLPGGFGTIDELFEVISLNQLKIINKKIILLDNNNYWKELKVLLKHFKKHGFLYNNNDNIIFKKSVTKTIEYIKKINKVNQ